MLTQGLKPIFYSFMAVCFALLFILFLFIQTVHAATLTASTTINIITVGATCQTSEWRIRVAYQGVNNDGGGVDNVGVVVTDANNVAIAVSWSGISPPSLAVVTSDFGNGNVINNITASPLTITVYDIVTTPMSGVNTQASYNQIVGQSAPVLDTLTYNPSNDVPSCPTTSASSSISAILDEDEDNEYIPLPAFYDGRINNYDSAAPIAVYPHNVNGDVGLVVYSSEGEFLLVISPEQIANAPADNSLVAEGGGISVYRLAGGSWQVNAPQYNGKTYIIIFPELFHSGGYESFELDN